MISRRTFLGGTGLAGAALLGGCGSGDEASTVLNGSTEDDIGLLNDLLEIELGAVAAYERGAELLSGSELELAELFARQEHEHADKLTAAIEELGGTPVDPKSKAEYARELDLGKLETEEDMLLFAADLENMAVGGYNDAVAALTVPELRRTLFEIVAVEAEHLTVIRGALGELQVPDAFVVG